MDSYEGSGSPRYREDDIYPYRRRASPSPNRRRLSLRGRSRSPFTIDRYQPVDRDRDHRDYSRDRLARDHRVRDTRESYRDRPTRRDRDNRLDHRDRSERERDRDDYYAREREFHDADRERDRDRLDRRRGAPPPLPPQLSPAGPGVIDRYVPGQDSPAPVIRTNTLPNPLSLDFQVGFNWFAEWWRAEQAIKEEKERAKYGGRRPGGLKGEKEAREDRERERAKIQEAYDKYKTELQMKMAKMFVQQHRAEEWFKEKYIKDMKEPIRRKLREYRKNNALKQWQADLANKLFDDFTLEGIYRSESDGAGGVIEKEEGEATAVGETLGVLDLVPVKGGDLRDDAALHAPALLIKTLAPNVSREKIEEFCRECLGEDKGGFEWLSLSDPNPTKRFHRMGWVMLKLDPDAGQEDNGIDRSDDRVDVVEEGEEDGEKDKEKRSKKSPALATAENALPYVNEKSIHDPLRGDFTAHVGVHFPPPNPRKKALWDLFSAPARIERDLELAKRITRKFDDEMGDGLDGVRAIEEKVDSLSREGRLQSPATATPGSKHARNQKADVREGNDDEKPFEEQADTIPVPNEDAEEDEGEIGDDDEVDSPTLLAQKKELDLLVEYLRRVYNFCLFCVFEADSVHELVRKCPGGHLRRPRSGLSKLALEAAKASAKGEPFPLDASKSGNDTSKSLGEDGDDGEEGEEKEDRSKNSRRNNKRFTNRSQYQLYRAFNWVRTYEDKLFQVLEPENADLTRLGGQPLQAGLDIELKKFIKQEDENRYRCKVPDCTKLFKAEHFWRKHVEKRHPEWLKELTDELELINAYVLDPGHIVLGKDTTGPTNGYYGPGMNMGMNMSMSANGMKGYNLGNAGMLGAGVAASGSNHHTFSTHSGAGVPSFSGPWPMTVPDSSSRLASHHGPGAIRRGGGAGGYGRYNNRYIPYERRGPGSSTSGSGPLPYSVPPGRIYPSGSGLNGRGTAAAGTYPPAGFGGMSGSSTGGVAGSSSLGPGVVGAGSMGAMMGMAPGAGSGPPLPISAGNTVAGVGGPGPREAVQGRSLKSYEDLDAVGGEGGGELNY